jgi:3,4-dihydroxy 2-butanone 4-phosphate synthase/GTP cyclohydrolase II
MFHTNQDKRGTAYTVTVDAREGVSTGISASDRARRSACSASADTSPGRLQPARPRRAAAAREGGVLRRTGHTEAAVDLARLAGLRPAGVLCEVVSQEDEGDMARAGGAADLQRRARTGDHLHRPTSSPGRSRTEKQVAASPRAQIPTRTAVPRRGYQSVLDGTDHVALVQGDLGDGRGRLCACTPSAFTGDVFRLAPLRLRPQLDAATGRRRPPRTRRRASTCAARGPGHRLMHKLAGLLAAGHPAATPSNAEPRAGPARRRPRLRHRRADPRRPRASHHAAA